MSMSWDDEFYYDDDPEDCLVENEICESEIEEAPELGQRQVDNYLGPEGGGCDDCYNGGEGGGCQTCVWSQIELSI